MPRGNPGMKRRGPGATPAMSKPAKRSRKKQEITMAQLRKDIERGCRYFWSRPHRWGQQPEGMGR